MAKLRLWDLTKLLDMGQDIMKHLGSLLSPIAVEGSYIQIGGWVWVIIVDTCIVHKTHWDYALFRGIPLPFLEIFENKCYKSESGGNHINIIAVYSL